MSGLINSENVQRPLHQLQVRELCPNRHILSVMYITDSVNLLTYMFWGDEKPCAF
jgi:hypothetical protein